MTKMLIDNRQKFDWQPQLGWNWGEWWKRKITVSTRGWPSQQPVLRKFITNTFQKEQS